jgi:hypothetical protein
MVLSMQSLGCRSSSEQAPAAEQLPAADFPTPPAGPAVDEAPASPDSEELGQEGPPEGEPPPPPPEEEVSDPGEQADWY